MSGPFFPEPIFAWTFCAVLLGLLLAATYQDLKRLIIPKWLTLPTLALGIVFNLVRGGWLGGGWGVLDGLLFSLGGFAAGFALFLVMWLLGTCGGGDVKLFAALGAWVGALLALYVLCGTLLVLVLLTVLRPMLRAVLVFDLIPAPRTEKQPGQQSGQRGRSRPRRRLVAYSLPVAVSTACILLWVFRVELQLSSAPPAPGQVQARMQP